MIFAKKAKELAKKCFVGEVTTSKVVLWLFGTVCLLSGIVYGLCIAPMTYGISIGCNNGCNCGNNNNLPEEKQDKEEEEV